MKRNPTRNKSPSRWRWLWSTLWAKAWVDHPFYSVAEQRSFDLEMARLRAKTNVALSVSQIAYGFR